MGSRQVGLLGWPRECAGPLETHLGVSLNQAGGQLQQRAVCGAGSLGLINRFLQPCGVTPFSPEPDPIPNTFLSLTQYFEAGSPFTLSMQQSKQAGSLLFYHVWNKSED